MNPKKESIGLSFWWKKVVFGLRVFSFLTAVGNWSTTMNLSGFRELGS
jgi:hypothetical protein